MPDLLLTNGSRIIFEGDSITNAKKFTHYLMSYFYTRYPELSLSVTQYGRGGTAILSHVTADTVDLNYNHYDKHIYSLNPDYVFCLFGHNGGYTAAEHHDAYELLIQKHIIGRSGAIPVLVGAQPKSTATGTPSIGLYDDQNEILSGENGDFPFVKLWQILAPVFTNPDNWYAIQYPATQNDPETHPGIAGHIAMTYKIIEGLGFSTDISTATINAATETASAQTDCTVSAITRNRFGGIDFERLDERIPFQMDADGWNDALTLYAEIETFQNYDFTISNLPHGTYTIYCDDAFVGFASNAELAVGLNVSKFRQGPVYDQGQDVLAKIRLMQGRDTPLPRTGLADYEGRATAKYDEYNQDIGNLSGLPGALSAPLNAINALVADVHTAAIPITRTWSIRLTGWTPPIGIPDCAWGALHPITEPRPTQPGAWPSAQATGYYYIDNTHVSATDANTYGYPNAPRLTIPETTYAAGIYVEIHGGPYVRRSGDTEHDFTFAGTEANPCWMVAHDPINRPEIQGGLEIAGTYAIIDGIRRTRDLTTSRGPGTHVGGDADGGTHHICLRNCEADGDEIELPGSASSCMSISGSVGDEVHHIVFYNTSVTYYGNMLYTQTVEYSDDHAFLPGQYCNNVWIVDCEAHDCSGDAVQVTGNNAIGDARANNIYIGRNSFSYTGENAIDVKSSVDVVISQNTLTNFPGGLGGNGTAIVIQQEGGSGCDNVWALFNDVSACYEGIRAEEVATNIYAIGNVFHGVNADGHAAITARTSGTSLTLVDNTVYGLPTGISASQWDGQGGNAPNIQFHGNLWVGKADATAAWHDGDSTTVPNDSDRNAYDSGSVFKAIWEGTTYNSLAAFTAGKGQDTNGAYGDCDLIDPDNDDFGIGTASVARGINTEHAAYAAFESRYGLDIRYDFYGNARPASGAWDAGALQYGSVRSLEAPEETPTAPINTVAPSITGAPVEGTQVTSSAGSWSGAVSYAYQWTRTTGSVVVGTSLNYTPVLADVGSTLTFRVTATNATGSTALTTAASAVVVGINVPPPPPPQPTFSVFRHITPSSP